MIERKIFLLFFLLIPIVCIPQVSRETRAVWVSTNYRLDWPPPTYDQEAQKKALINIFDDIKSKNLNTVYFQVRSNGTVMFRSSFEALSPYITGEVDGKASYDPLKFAIDEAHKRGLELHTWINTMRCFASSETSILENPNHIYQRRPDWVIQYKQNGRTEYWLDPGLPEVREYLVNLIEEMVKNYDVDGIHLDFIRYPGRDFDDSFSYNIYGNGMLKDDWRRENLLKFMELLNERVRKINPYIKIGAAPVGIYKNQKDGSGLEGYSEVYQDSREWLKKGLLDYVVPQIYWNFEDNPKFDVVAKDWEDNSYGKNVVLGIAAYKPEVKNELEKMISYSRSINASGVSFFRYSNIKDVSFDSFSYKTFPASMPWLDGTTPDAPSNLRYVFREGKPSLITLNWQSPKASTGADSINYYALYSLSSRRSAVTPDDLLEIVPADKTSVTLAVDYPKRINYYFTLKSVTKLWNESIDTSNVVEVTFPVLNMLSGVSDIFDNPILLRNKTGSPKVLLFVNTKTKIDISGNRGSGTVSLYSKELLPGKNIISLNDSLTGIYSLTIKYSTGREVKLNL